MIFFNKVTKIYPPYLNKEERVVLEDVSFRLNKGDFICLVGRSGAGKTTLFNLLLGEEKPTSGEVFFDGIDVHKASVNNSHRIKRRIGTVLSGLQVTFFKNSL